MASLDDKFLEDLSAQLLAECGFKPDIDHFAIFGICANYQAKLLSPSANGH